MIFPSTKQFHGRPDEPSGRTSFGQVRVSGDEDVRSLLFLWLFFMVFPRFFHGFPVASHC
jgi:hypothetical protein